MSDRTRPNGAYPRPHRPKPPSTRPPSGMDASRQKGSHEVYVQIANLQMARARQNRIRASLQNQVDQCSREIAQIDAKLKALYDKAGLEPTDPSEKPQLQKPDDEDGFEYEY